MEDRYTTCLNFILGEEGGYSNDPDDPGGATNLGITQNELDDYDLKHGEKGRSVKDLVRQDVVPIYKENYWDPTHAEWLPKGLDLVLFDTAVNMGVGTSIEFFCSVLHVPQSVQYSQTLSNAIHMITPEALPSVINAYLAVRITRYHSIVAHRPASAKFLHGWLNRVEAVRKAADS